MEKCNWFPFIHGSLLDIYCAQASIESDLGLREV